VKKAWRSTLIAGLASAAAIVGAYGLIRSTSRHDVLKRSKAAERGASVHLVYEGIYLSLHHGMLVSYRIVGPTELVNGHWYLIPWREVQLSK